LKSAYQDHTGGYPEGLSGSRDLGGLRRHFRVRADRVLHRM